MGIPEIPVPIVPSVILYVLMGTLSAMLANRGIMVFHDGLRPMMPALYEAKSMTRVQISAVSFALMIGFFVGFGVPFSIGKVIPLVYLIFLVTDWIGISLPGSFEKGWYKDKKSLLGLIGSGILGGLWGALMAVGVGAIPNIISMMPVDMLTPMSEISNALTPAFSVFPILAIGYRFGMKKGIAALLISLLVRQISLLIGASSGEPWVLASGTVILIILVARESSRQKKEQDDDGAELSAEMDDMFIQRVSRIKSYLIPIMLLGGIIGAAINYPVITLDPPVGPLLIEGKWVEAIICLVSLGIAFFPMKFSTALLSGCMMTFSFFDAAIAILMPNWMVAAVVCAVWKGVEVYLIVYIGKFLNRFPGIRSVSDDIRTAIYNAMEIGLLIGSAIAANAIAPGWGFMILPAVWILNEYAKSPIVKMGLSPICVIIVGIVANIFKLLGLV